MTRSQLLGIAATLAGLTAGAVLFVNYATGDAGPDEIAGGFGMLDVLDRSSCTVAACNAPACTTAKNVLLDAGSSCTVGFVDCSARIGPTARAVAADAGLLFSAALYQRVRLVGMRCPVAGGFAYGVPVDDGGWPIFAVATTTPLCVRAPLDGGLTCLRDLRDGDGGRFFGRANVFPAALAAGANCEPVECTVLAGEDPDTSL